MARVVVALRCGSSDPQTVRAAQSAIAAAVDIVKVRTIKREDGQAETLLLGRSRMGPGPLQDRLYRAVVRASTGTAQVELILYGSLVYHFGAFQLPPTGIESDLSRLNGLYELDPGLFIPPFGSVSAMLKRTDEAPASVQP